MLLVKTRVYPFSDQITGMGISLPIFKRALQQNSYPFSGQPFKTDHAVHQIPQFFIQTETQYPISDQNVRILM